METIKLKVKDGRAVVDPATMRFVGPEGIELKALNSYWTRRLKAGDVEIAHVIEVPEVKEEKEFKHSKRSKGEG